MNNVSALPGCRQPDAAPCDALIEALRDLLHRAQSGELQSFIGTGFTADGLRATIWCDHNPNVHETLGSLAWLQHEYVDRHSE